VLTAGYVLQLTNKLNRLLGAGDSGHDGFLCLANPHPIGNISFRSFGGMAIPNAESAYRATSC